MTVSRMEILYVTVSLYDSRAAAVVPADLTDELDVDRETVQTRFDEFKSKSLLTRGADGYRPTVTARELLELDLDDDLLVVLDPEPED
jgi:predicted transcriptional regulator